MTDDTRDEMPGSDGPDGRTLAAIPRRRSGRGDAMEGGARPRWAAAGPTPFSQALLRARLALVRPRPVRLGPLADEHK